MAGIIEIRSTLPNFRPTRAEINMTLAEVIALRGTCKRKQVGCVIIKNNRVISTGYNGSVSRVANCKFTCNIENKCTHAIHAEVNAIAACARQGIALAEATLYCTTAPCYECAKLIIQSGIVEVIYDGDYTNDEGIKLINQTGYISCKQLKNAE